MYLQGKLICTAFLLFLCSAQAKAPPTSGGKSTLSDASSTVTPEIEVPAQPVLADIPLLSEIGHNPTADTIKADFQVSAAGSSTYRVPLVFPAGIAGTTPQISFSYDSQSGNGPLGVGWQLSGLSTISRCRKTLSEDGYFAAIKFNQQDAICLDGRRLTLVSGSEWSNQATYHTKIETGQRVRLLHNAGTIYFSVNRPDGSKYIYGNSSDSIQKDGQSNQIYSWHLSEIIDASGNKIEFEYINGERHQALLTKIEYSGNVVNFNYDSLRLDKKSGYFQGNKFFSDMRLNNVITTNHNDVIISSYHLDYIYSSNTQSSLLNVLQQCNGKREDEGGSCMKTTFSHNDNLYYPTKVRNIALEDFVAGEKIQKILSADVNGDGKSDYVFSYGVGDNIKLKVALLFNSFSIVDGFDVFARSGFSLADTDGDGAAEIIVRDYNCNNESEVIYHWSGNFDGGFFEAEIVDPSIKDHGTFGADFDGNGLPDRQNLQQHWLNKNNSWTSIASFSGADLLSFLGHNDFDTNGGLTRVTHESMSESRGWRC